MKSVCLGLEPFNYIIVSGKGLIHLNAESISSWNKPFRRKFVHHMEEEHWENFSAEKGFNAIHSFIVKGTVLEPYWNFKEWLSQNWKIKNRLKPLWIDQDQKKSSFFCLFQLSGMDNDWTYKHTANVFGCYCGLLHNNILVLLSSWKWVIQLSKEGTDALPAQILVWFGTASNG